MKSIALEASAGSGKTFTLSVRYIALVLSGAKIADIVALTFTKKAVNEMKERITKVFLELENKGSELAELEKLLGLSKDEILALRDKLKRYFCDEELRIYTFDSFFAKILRLFATHEGLSPDFEQCDELDIQTEFLQSFDEKTALKLIKDIKNLNMSLDEFLTQINNLYFNYTGKAMRLNAEPIDLFAEFLKIKEHLSHQGKTIDNWLAKISDLASLLESSLLKFNSATIKKACEKSQNFNAFYFDFLEKVAKYYAYLEANQINLCFEYLEMFSQVAKKYHQENKVLSFSDVALYVHKILQNKDLKELFYFRLNSQLSHLLIDEFQDTSIIQYEIIRPLVEEIVAGLGLNDVLKSFFYVGDKKQSIYSFRGAKQEVFDLFYKNPDYNIAKEVLKTNYRSKKAIVEFVNQAFLPLYADYVPQEIASKDEGKVSKIVTNNDEYLNEIFKKIAKLLSEGASLKDICILARNNALLFDIAEFLRSKNIRVNFGSAKAINQFISVRVLLEFAKYCIFGDKAYEYFLHSVLGFTPEKIYIDIKSAPAKIYHSIIKHLGVKKDEAILQFLQDVANKKHFLETIYSEANDLIISENAEGSVQLMTIHKSKGLQFEHLICVHLDKKEPNDTGLKIEYDFQNHTWYGFKKENKDIKELRKLFDKNYKNALERYEITRKFDEINTYYVAYTRAVSSLCVIKSEDAGLKELDYELIKNEEISDDFLDYKYEEKHENIEQLSYSFCDDIPLQNIKTKQVSSEEIELGIAFHYFCELSDFSAETFEKCYEITQQKFYKVDEEKLKNLCQKILICDDFLQLIRGKFLIKEQEIAKKGEFFRTDLLAIDEESIAIIDFKSSNYHHSYAKQLENYAKILPNPNSKKIQKFIVYFKNGQFFCKEI